MTTRRLRLVAGMMLSIAGLIVTPTYAEAPEATSTTVSVLSALPIQPTTTTSTVPVPPDARCPMWWSLALDVGFTIEQMPTLDRIMFVESRCDETQHNATDPNGGSHSLTQINGFWCRPSRYYPSGYLQTMQILTTCDDLYTPEINLRAALVLVDYSRSAGLSEWAQWAWL